MAEENNGKEGLYNLVQSLSDERNNPQASVETKEHAGEFMESLENWVGISVHDEEYKNRREQGPKDTAQLEGTRKVVYGILEYLSQEHSRAEIRSKDKESLDVAMQCVEAAFGITTSDRQYRSSRSIREMYEAEGGSSKEGQESSSVGDIPTGEPVEDSDCDLDLDVGKEETGVPPDAILPAAARYFNKKGDDAMSNNEFSRAVFYYSRAIELDRNNSAYFSNRAAAYTKMGNLEQAIQDGEKATLLLVFNMSTTPTPKV